MNSLDLGQHELNGEEIYRNLPPSVLYEHAIRYEKEATIAENGALVAYSGEKTGRSPKDKRIVKNPASEKDVWWGTTNVPLDPKSYRTVRQRALDYLSVCARIYCFDGFAGWEPKYRIKVRVICSRPYHALFIAYDANPAHRRRTLCLSSTGLRDLQRWRFSCGPPDVRCRIEDLRQPQS